MPLGESFLQPSDIPQPLYAASQNRSLPFLKGTVSPLPAQYGEMAFPNMNFVFNRPHLPLDANPPLGRYALLTSKLGWFSWVYKDRDPLGFTQHPNLLRMLGVDQIVSDQSLPLGPPFTAARNQTPFLYQLSPVLPKASLMDHYQVGVWPDSLGQAEKPEFNPFQTAIFDSNPGTPSAPPHPLLKMKEPEILQWNETHISLRADLDHPAFLLLQKTYLPGWKASVNGNPVKPLRCDFVLTAIPLSPGLNQVELSFEPTSLRLGFFLFLSLFGLWASLGFKRLLS